MSESHFNKRTILLHPFVVFSTIWFSVAIMYSLHLSNLLLFSTREVIQVTSYIYLPFVLTLTIYSIIYHLLRPAYYVRPKPIRVNVDLLEQRLSIWFMVWLLVTAGEIALSGGIPVVWLFLHSTKTYAEFGIHSLHGLANSLLLSIAVCRFAMYINSGERRHLRVPIVAVAWPILVITRQVMLTSLLEYAVIFLLIKSIRLRTVARITIAFAAFVLLFGAIGDLRSGSETFRSLAQPTEHYPDWLPSGILWVYIYITTPINNLIYAMPSIHPVGSLLFPNTVSSLFPTVFRELLYHNDTAVTASDLLVTEAFNVSTAYIGPFQDLGLFGIMVFSSWTAFTCQFFWYRTNLRDTLIFAVLIQCLVFTLFDNLFFLLPVIAQVFWLYYFFMPRMRFGHVAMSSLHRAKFVG